MAEESKPKEGVYIYCIIDFKEGEPEKNFGPLGMGNRGDELRSLSYKDIAMVVSNSPIKKYPVSRENCLTHERAIEAVMKEGFTVLPVRYCTIADDEVQVKKILKRDYEKFKELLLKMENKVELGLKAIFDEKLIYQDILAKNKEIRLWKEKLIDKPPEKTHNQRVNLGRMVEAALNTEKEEAKTQTLLALKELSEDYVVNDNYGERMFLNASFLVANNKEQEFTVKVDELNERFGQRVKLKYVGGMPPFNFVCLEINLEVEGVELDAGS
ncbi:MAG: GvpL/GvpF family gas vesicle protein [candidate division Zixibacteria bacterium]|nr:GvpL/GvpF family gas vesicle protein [candidate division Zixibacteria bacterium]